MLQKSQRSICSATRRQKRSLRSRVYWSRSIIIRLLHPISDYVCRQLHHQFRYSMYSGNGNGNGNNNRNRNRAFGNGGSQRLHQQLYLRQPGSRRLNKDSTTVTQILTITPFQRTVPRQIPVWLKANHSKPHLGPYIRCLRYRCDGGSWQLIWLLRKNRNTSSGRRRLFSAVKPLTFEKIERALLTRRVSKRILQMITRLSEQMSRDLKCLSNADTPSPESAFHVKARIGSKKLLGRLVDSTTNINQQLHHGRAQ